MLRTSARTLRTCASHARVPPRTLVALSSVRALSMTSRALSSPPSTDAAPLFRLDQPTAAEEEADFRAQVASIEAWFSSPRFAATKRPYSAELVATKRGTQPISPLHPSNISAKKLFAALSRAAAEGKPLPTMGAIDPIQMTQMAPHLEVLYVSGWASSSVLTTGNNEVGPDLADYPYTTVPNQVQRLRKAQELHDRKMWDERRTGNKATAPWVDYLRPIIADGDTGFVFLPELSEGAGADLVAQTRRTLVGHEARQGLRRVGRLGSPPRGPASRRQEVRSPRRQSPRPHVGARLALDRSAHAVGHHGARDAPHCAYGR